MEIILYQGDCIDKMKGIADGSIDMILADLPYGTTRNRWDSVIPFEPLWEQYHRVCKKNAAICLFGQMPFSAALVMSNRKEFRYEWIWEKCIMTGFLNANRMPLKKHESILVFYRALPTYIPQLRKGNMHNRSNSGGISTNYGEIKRSPTYESEYYYPYDIIRCSKMGKRFHPTQKPVPLLEYLIRTYTNPGETVLDNTMGSGSTGVAAANTGRNFIGIELDPCYFQIAQERIREAQELENVPGL